MTDVERVAAGLTKAQRAVKPYGMGHAKLTKPVLAMSEAGLIHAWKARDGWRWAQTEFGKAVRAHLEGKAHD